MNELPVFYGNDRVGYGTIKKEGLIYIVKCFCRLPDGATYEIVGTADNNEIKLGICVPIRGGFESIKRISASKLDPERINLIVRSREENASLIKVNCENPFQLLQSLDSMVLIISDGEYYLKNDVT